MYIVTQLLTPQMHRLLGQHALLEQLHIAIGIARHQTVLCRGRLVILCLPIAKDLKRLILDDSASELERETYSIVYTVLYIYLCLSTLSHLGRALTIL